MGSLHAQAATESRSQDRPEGQHLTSTNVHPTAAYTCSLGNSSSRVSVDLLPLTDFQLSQALALPLPLLQEARCFLVC